jgi:transposase
MTKPYSEDLRTRGGGCCGGRKLPGCGTAVQYRLSSVVRWAQRFGRTGSVAANSMGGERNSRLKDERDWLLARVAAGRPMLHDIRRELAARNVRVGYGTIWRFFAKEKITFKKNRMRRRAGPAWETFMGNAGLLIRQHGFDDARSSKRLGVCEVVRTVMNKSECNAVQPDEIARLFARDAKNILAFVPSFPPVALSHCEYFSDDDNRPAILKLMLLERLKLNKMGLRLIEYEEFPNKESHREELRRFVMRLPKRRTIIDRRIN